MEVRELENAQLRERARAALGRYFLQAVSVSFIARFFLTAGHVEDAGNAEEMCIRDRYWGLRRARSDHRGTDGGEIHAALHAGGVPL